MHRCPTCGVEDAVDYADDSTLSNPVMSCTQCGSRFEVDEDADYSYGSESYVDCSTPGRRIYR